MTVNALLVPIHLDALVLENEETVLEAMADFSKLPYYDGKSKQNVNADVPYISEEIVSHPFRDRNLRLGRGVHLHWALPDALTQGVSTPDGVQFPAVPDRWLVTRGDADGIPQKQWIVESDYLHPESAAETKPPAGTVSFPLPPRPAENKWQPYRYLGRNWVVSEWRPENEEPAEYLNSLADGGETHWHRVISAGLTAIGYGEPSFAAFYPNCRSVFGLHDPDVTTFARFKKVSYDVIGWYDQPEKRDCLSKDAAIFKQTREAIAKRIRNEYESSGHVPKVNSMEVWHEALAHHFGWVVSGADKKKKAERIFCYASLKPSADADIEADPAVSSGSVDIAVGNTASEALSAYLAHQDSDDTPIIEEKLEALDLGHRLEHRQLDIGPKFREARHDKGFKSVRSGMLYAVPLERDSQASAADGISATVDPAAREVPAQTTGTLPCYLAHALNQLNMAQLAYQRANEDIDSLRHQIYHDWTLFMRAMRPPEGLQEGYPDPVEIARFIEKTGLLPLKRKLAATGDIKVQRERIGDNEGRDTPITGASVPSHTADTAIAARVAECMKMVVDGLSVSNQILAAFSGIDQAIASTQKSGSREPASLETALKSFLQKHGIPYHERDNAQTLRNRIHRQTAEFSDPIRHGAFRDDLLNLLLLRRLDLAIGDAQRGDPKGLADGKNTTVLLPVDNQLVSASHYLGSTRIVTASEKMAIVWDAESGKKLHELKGHDGVVWFACFAPGGARIVTESWDRTAIIWDAESGKKLHTLRNKAGLSAVRYDSQGKRVVAACSMDAIVWDAESGKQLHTLGHNGVVESARFDPQGKRIVTACRENIAIVWDAESGKKLHTLTGHENRVLAANFDPQGKRIVTASDDTTAIVWDAESGKKLHILSGHLGKVRSADFDPHGKRIVTASDDKTAVVWDAESGEKLLTLAHRNRVNSAGYDLGGKRIITASDDSKAVVWDAENGKKLLTLAHEKGVSSANFDLGGERIVTACRDTTAIVWDVKVRLEPQILIGHARGVSSASYDPLANRIVTASDDKTAVVWDAESGEKLWTLTHERGVVSASFDNEGKHIVTASRDKNAFVWDAASGEQRVTLSGHRSAVVCTRYAPDGNRIVTASSDKTAMVWDAETGKQLKSYQHESRVLSASFDNEGKRIVTVCRESDPIVWDVESGKQLCTWSEEDGNRSVSAEFDSTGKRVVTAYWDNTACVWDAQTGDKLLTLRGHQGGVRSASFDPDGKRIVTASSDKTAIVWDASTGKIILTYSGHENEVRSASFAPDGKRIVTASYDKTAISWDSESGKKLFTLPDPEGNIVSASYDFPEKGEVALESPDAVMRSLLDGRGIPVDRQDTQALRSRIHRLTADFTDPTEHERFRDDLTNLLKPFATGHDGQPKAVKMRYALRQIDAPRYYQPNDPVVLMAGEDLKPTERHGTDGKDRDDGKLECKTIFMEDLDSISNWQTDEVPAALKTIRNATLDEQPDGDEIGARRWQHQPWHPFLMEWQAEMFPISAGSNREKNRQSYATGFMAQNFNLPESAVDLKLKPGAGTGPRTADTGIYSGICVLTDHASDLLLDKLDRYLKKAAQPDDRKTETVAGTEEKLRAIREFLADRKEHRRNTLSQSLDGFHDALLQRHQILQLPITDPIGFHDMKPLTDAVRDAAQGRHSTSPLRRNDFTPIRAGTMKLRQLRLVDTFGRVKQVLEPGSETPILTSEVLRSPAAPNEINLPPRLLQPARINFRWLSADHAPGKEMDEPESNVHPAYTPVCGWILPNNLDNSLLVYDNKGQALGTIIAVDGRPAWQPAPGSELPRWEIEKGEAARMNPHLRTLINTIVNELGSQDAAFFKQFLATLNNALETIAPEDFAHHESLALLMGRPIAVVRAMVSLELRGQPAVNQSLSAFLPDMIRAVEPHGNSAEGQERRAQFKLAASETEDFLQALDQRKPSGLRPAFEKQQIRMPKDDHEIEIKLEAMEGEDARWRIHLSARTYIVRRDAGTVHVYLDTHRTTDDFTHVRFPIRIGEDQQLNDGLVGYFVEEIDGDDYHYKDNVFFAPQAATHKPLGRSKRPAKVQQLADQLDLSQVPVQISKRLEHPWSAVVTIDKTGRRWRIDTEGHVYNLIRGDKGIELFELKDSSSEHIRIHWKDPINLMQSIDDPPQKLTMLVDPQGSVHAVSGILPTKSISIPSDQYADALRSLEVTFLSSPILTERDKTRVPLAAEVGYQWSWLTRRGEAWIETTEIDRIETQAGFSSQKIVEGWLKLSKGKEFMTDPTQNLQLKLTITEVNQILEALGQRTYADVYRLVGKIQQQADQQLSEKEAGGSLASSEEQKSAGDNPSST